MIYTLIFFGVLLAIIALNIPQRNVRSERAFNKYKRRLAVFQVSIFTIVIAMIAVIMVYYLKG
jgi:hypothetical protein